MKKAISMLLVLAMLCTLAACGSGTTPTAKPTDGTDGTPAPTDSVNTGDDLQRGGVGDGQFKESPALNEKVKAGELPAIEDRLPKEPAVVEVEEIGVYGGSYKGAAFGPTVGQVDTEGLRVQSLLTIEKDLKTFKPNILKDYTISDDFKEFNLQLREGMKWSDGTPLTADDFMFWYEDILLNEELSPSIASDWRTNDDVMLMEKVGDYEVKITFKDPKPAFEIIMARASAALNRTFFAPKEYLKKWHPTYNPDAAALAKEENYESWVQCFQAHCDNSQSAIDTNAPGVTPWVLTKIDDAGNRTFTRNPYYFVVDQEGNQLPYIDEQVAVIVENADVRALKLISGELHAAGENPLPVSTYTMFKESEQEGDYTVYLFDNTRGSDCAFTFNITHKDPDMRELFNNVKFRQAMSLALNRNEINETLYYGKANVRQATAAFNVSFLDPTLETNMSEYDVDKANQLLDECGLKWNDAHTARLLPNGKDLTIVLETIEEFVPMSEIACEYWQAVGVNVQLKQEERSYYLERGKSNDRDMQAFTLDSVAEFNLRSLSFGPLRPSGTGTSLGFNQAYVDWFASGGTAGEEPPEDIKQLEADCLKFGTLSDSDPEYATLGASILKRIGEQVWYIGVSVAPRLIIISNRLGNTPTEGTFANDYNFWKPYRGDTWYFKY